MFFVCFIGCEYIPGLVSRNDKPLEYLGLYNTANEAAYRRTIPALKVSVFSENSTVFIANYNEFVSIVTSGVGRRH